MNTDKRFAFQCQGLPDDTFTVVSFSGVEEFSRPYEFVVTLASRRDDLGLQQVGQGLATFTMLRDKDDMPFHGVVVRFEQLKAVRSLCFYRALLAPRLWALSLNTHNRVFLDASAPEFLQELLTQSQVLSSRDFDFRLSGNYPKREFVCQYQESDFAFFSRWLEREGMYFYFEQQEQGELLVVTDHAMAHQDLPGQPVLEYRQVQGMNFETREEFVHSFVCEESMAPKTVRVKDYNYRTPALDISGSADVGEGALGEVYIYGDNVKTTEEAKRLATFHAEEVRARSKRHKGRGTSPFLRPGYTFKLANHFRKDANREYLTVSVNHEGQQTGYLITLFGRAVSGQEAKNFYSNSFTAMPSDIQYRHPRTTKKPRFHGLVNAVVDGAGTGQYAVLDDKGRYKVRLPFDLSGRSDGMASSWIRMAQPYGGDNHGMHFPLLKGTEVLLAFVNGDVDRPVIAHAVPNFQQLSVVKDSNAPANALRSASGNQLVMGDKKGQEFIGMFSPFHKSSIAVGSMKAGGGGSISLSTDGDFDSFSAGAKNEATFGASNEFVCGVTNEVFVGLKNELVAAISYSASLASQVEYVKGPGIELGDEASSLKNEEDTTGLEKLTLSGGVSAPLKGLISEAKGALALGMTGTAVAGAGIVGMSAPIGEGFLKEASLEWKDFSFGMGLGAAMTGTLMSFCSAGVVQELVEKFEAASQKAKTATIVLDKSGINSTVNCLVGPSATWTTEVLSTPGCPANLKSSIVISAKGQDITLTNKKNASITLSGGNSISLKHGAANPREIKISSSNVAITNKDGLLTVGSSGVVLKNKNPGASGMVMADGSKARMACGQNSVETTATGVELKFAGRMLKSGPLMINPAGIIQMG